MEVMHTVSLGRRLAIKKILLGAVISAVVVSPGFIRKPVKRFLASKGIIPPIYGYVDGSFNKDLFVWAMQHGEKVERDWRYEWVYVIDLERCEGCGMCEKACIAAHEPYPGQTWMKVYFIKGPDGKRYPLPRPCMQCQNAPCVNVCPVGANYYNEDGVVIIDKDRCIGCRMCMAACPYGARYFNWDKPFDLRRENHGDETKHPVGVVEKCMFCYTELAKGKLPACIEACPMRALFIGDKKQDIITNGEETYKFSEVLKKRKSFRLLEELGTEPRVYYLVGKKTEILYEQHIDFPLKP